MGLFGGLVPTAIGKEHCRAGSQATLNTSKFHSYEIKHLRSFKDVYWLKIMYRSQVLRIHQ